MTQTGRIIYTYRYSSVHYIELEEDRAGSANKFKWGSHLAVQRPQASFFDMVKICCSFNLQALSTNIAENNAVLWKFVTNFE